MARGENVPREHLSDDCWILIISCCLLRIRLLAVPDQQWILLLPSRTKVALLLNQFYWRQYRRLLPLVESIDQFHLVRIPLPQVIVGNLIIG